MKQQFFRNTFLVLAAAGMASVPTTAFAHQVQTNYILKGNSFQDAAPAIPELTTPEATSPEPAVQPTEASSLELHTTFSNGQPLKGAKVTVYAPDQSFRPYATGLTDSQGRYTFSPNAALPGEWEVKINRAGHSDIIHVPVSEEGIEADLIAQGDEVQDVHYASSPLMAVGSIAVAAACIGFARVKRKA